MHRAEEFEQKLRNAPRAERLRLMALAAESGVSIHEVCEAMARICNALEPEEKSVSNAELLFNTKEQPHEN